MKILFISANKLKEPYPVYPLGLDYVAGSLSADHQISGILDMNDFEDLESIGKQVRDIPADVIGISLRNIDNTEVKELKYFITQYQNLINEIRRNSTAIVILGGSAFTIFPSELMNALNADYGIIGEGERLNSLLDAIREKKDPLKIPGVITKSDVTENPAAVFPEPWDNRIARRFDAQNTNIAFYLKRGGMLNLQTKRGCSFKCIYCTYPHIEGSSLRLFDPDEIANTALELQNAGAKYIFITDSALNCSYPHSMEVARAFLRKKISIPWGAFFAPTKPPADYYKLLSDAGLTHAEFGTESLSNQMLKNYRKPFQVDDVFASHELAQEAGIRIAHYFLFGGPGETNTTLEESLKNSGRLLKAAFFVFCSMRIYPHTELYDLVKQENQITAFQSLLEPVFYKPAGISSREIINIVEERMKDRPNWVIGSGGRKTTRMLKRMFKEGHSGPLWEHIIQ
jgi:radical SAM superfamily enzyme YgiQ (UPF0313 family)